MKIVLVTACVVILATLATFAEARRIQKRGIAIWEFGSMIDCGVRGRSSNAYNGYGCWCGRGGQGRPVDSTDRCCRTHDFCYQRLVNSGACWSNQWFYTTYKRVGCTGCSSRNTGCGRALCRCDQAAVRCYQRAAFNPRNQNYNKRRC